jgi:Divergent AAA domain.
LNSFLLSKYICAIANSDSRTGLIAIGVTEDRRIKGVEDEEIKDFDSSQFLKNFNSSGITFQIVKYEIQPTKSKFLVLVKLMAKDGITYHFVNNDSIFCLVATKSGIKPKYPEPQAIYLKDACVLKDIPEDILNKYEVAVVKGSKQSIVMVAPKDDGSMLLIREFLADKHANSETTEPEDIDTDSTGSDLTELDVNFIEEVRKKPTTCSLYLQIDT